MAKKQEAKPAVSSPNANTSNARGSQPAKPEANAGAVAENKSEISAIPAVEPAKSPVETSLPVVEAPKLAGEEPSAASAAKEAIVPATEAMASAESAASEDAPASPIAITASGPSQPAAAPTRSSRFALLAASVAIAAIAGSFAGALSASGLSHLWPAPAGRPGLTDPGALQAIKAELAELAALKANLDGAVRSANGQFAKIADRLDRVEHAQTEPAGRIAHIADTIDRLEKKSAAAAAPASPSAPEITGTIGSSQPAADEERLSDRLLHNWIVRDVRGGRALVESRYGGVFDVGSGSIIPGLGRVETIKRQDGYWVVMTTRGMILSR